jgi:hypothetical protein
MSFYFLRRAMLAVAAISLLVASLPTRSEAGAPPVVRPKYGKISGYKFEDVNNNGEDDSEPRLSGWRIRLRSLGPIFVERTVRTDEDGEFSFRGLPLQRYEVCEILPDVTPPWNPTTPECVTIRLTSEHRFRFVAFGNHRNGQIHGYKFNDLNGNGVDNTEPRLSGWTIQLTNLGPTSISLTTTTDQDGEFHFDGIPLQSYLVCEIIPDAQPSWTPTRPACVTVNLTSGMAVGMVAFGNKRNEENNEGCTRTQGYWGNAPAGIARLRELVPTTLQLGSINYTADQLLAILNTPVGGNAVINLAHQLIAAKLNILNGASSSPIASTISLADAALNGSVIPPVGSAYVAPSSELGQTMVSLAGILDLYNNGRLGVPHCDD